MKKMKWLFTSILTLSTLVCFAQEVEIIDDRKGQFKQENIFIGTSLNLGISNRFFTVGLNPEIGYSINKWLDAGVSINFNYNTQSFVDFNNVVYQRNKSFIYGAGTFVRIWPANFLYIQAQPEHNWIDASAKDVSTNQSFVTKYNVSSLLLGVGYGTRNIGSSISYVTLMIDVLQNFNSPYRDQLNDPLPVFRAGFGIYLKPKRR